MKNDSTAQRKLNPRNNATEPPRPTVKNDVVIRIMQGLGTFTQK